MTNRDTLIAMPDWLAANLDNPTLKIIDASWYLPNQNRDPRAEYENAHIPGAVFFDQDKIVEPGIAMPHALPNPEIFAGHVSAMGISADDTIIVYDGPGYFPRHVSGGCSEPWVQKMCGCSTVDLTTGRQKIARRPATLSCRQQRALMQDSMKPAS